MKKFKKAKIILIAVLCTVLVLSVTALVGCADNGDQGDGTGDDALVQEPSNTPCTHDYQPTLNGVIQQATYDVEGREIRKCTLCGQTTTFIIPKLEKLPTSSAPGYYPILDRYTARVGDTLKTIQEKYFTTGWAFELDENTLVGDVTDEGRIFKAIFIPSEDKYEKEIREVVIVVEPRQ